MEFYDEFVDRFQQARSQTGEGGEEGEDSTSAGLKWIKFALNRKHTLFDAML